VTATFTIGIDTGGTFTDAFVSASDGRYWTVKVPTTPHDLTVCFAEAIRHSAAAVGLDLGDFLRKTRVIRFSSTIATNTILTRSGPKLGVIVTAGHERSLYGAAEGGHIFQFLPPDMVSGIEERVRPDGVVERPPDPDEVNQVVRSLLERGARILVVSLANAAVNPENERVVLAIIDRSYPRHYLGAVPTLLSTHVSPVAGDAARTAAAVVNAYVHKKLATSLYRAEDDLRASGFRHPLLVVSADGTVTRVARTRALSTYQSGPAAGVQAAALLARACGVEAALTADVGGTSTDLSVVVRGRALLRRQVDVGGLDVAQPSVELFSLALGGGSICRVEGGEVTVGPDSAGAAPGPACFGLGGRSPTVTDAWLVLGYLDPHYYLGGRRKLFPDLARQALDEGIGRVLGVSTEEAALAVKEAAERTAARGLREMLARPAVRTFLGERRVEDLALVAYGGAGGILLPAVARELGLGRVFLSALSPVFSAFGVSTFDVRHRYESRALADGEVERALAPLVEAARRDARGEGFDPDRARLGVSVLDEDGKVLVDEVPPSRLSEALARKRVAGRVVTIVLSATCDVPKADLPREERAPSDGEVEADGRRDVILGGGGKVEVSVYRRERLRAGSLLPGPCLVEGAGSTYLIPEDASARVDDFGTVVVT
jgi:N-methylhydantoinase A